MPRIPELAFEDDDDEDWSDPDEDELAWEAEVWDRLRGQSTGPRAPQSSSAGR